MKRLGLAFLILTAWCGCSGSVPAGWMGAYRLADGRVVSIRESTKDTYRYRFEDGRSGRLCRSKEGVYVSGDGFAVCKPETLTVTFAAEPAGLVWAESGSEPQTGRKLGRSLPAVFDADGITLRGRVDLPEGPGPHPAVVLVHGSGETAVTRTWPTGTSFLPAGWPSSSMTSAAPETPRGR